MTPKEKAQELFTKMKGFRVKHSHAKKCARIAVLTVIDELKSIPMETVIIDQTHSELHINYWQEVLTEINNIKTP